MKKASKNREHEETKQREAGVTEVNAKRREMKISTNHVLLVFVMPGEDEPRDVRRNRKTSLDTLLRKDPKKR